MSRVSVVLILNNTNISKSQTVYSVSDTPELSVYFNDTENFIKQNLCFQSQHTNLFYSWIVHVQYTIVQNIAKCEFLLFLW